MQERGAKRFSPPDTEWLWADPVLVECPRCSSCAAVTSDVPGDGRDDCSARLTCATCAFNSEWAGESLHVLIDGEPVTLRRGIYGWVHPGTGRRVGGYNGHVTRQRAGVEARFGLALWLRLECCGGRLLWANNAVHLDYLDSYIGATMRERPPDTSSQLYWRLPGWMKDRKHRDEVLRGLARLRERLPVD